MSLHWGMVLNVAAKKHISQRKCQAAAFIIGLLAAAYGVYVFITRNFLTYMFLPTSFRKSYPKTLKLQLTANTNL